MRIIPAVVLGMVVGGASSSVIVSLKGPVFAWEMAGMIMIIITGIFGGIVGGLSATFCSLTQVAIVLRGCIGLCVGGGLGFAVGYWISVNSSANNPKAPEELAFWIVAMVVIAGGLSGLVCGLLAKTSNS
jgi:hypothetical protein